MDFQSVYPRSGRRKKLRIAARAVFEGAADINFTQYPEALVFIETADGRCRISRKQLKERLDDPLFCDAYSLWARLKRYGLGEPIEKKTNLEAQCIEVIESEWNLYRKSQDRELP